MHTTTNLLIRLREPTTQSEAWREFAQLFAPEILSHARRHGFQPTDAEDVAQTILAKIPELLGEYTHRSGREFRGWLFRITANECLKRRRQSRRITGAVDIDIPDTPETPAFVRAEETEYLQRLVTRAITIIRPDFSDATLAAFTAVAIHGRRAAEVASELGITVSAVHMARFRVLSRLREVVGGLLD